MRDFEYEPLPSLRHIRLLQYLDTEEGEPLRFELYPLPLEDLDKCDPSTFALSYTWGEPIFDHMITLNDCSSSITANLHNALSNLAPRKIPLWVDAICINQKDAVEKSSQILLMGDIYARSNTCIVWLGAESDDSPLGWNFLCELAVALDYQDGETSADMLVMLGRQPPLERQSAKNRLQKFVDESRLVRGSPECLAIGRIFSRPWFSRIWVMQEVFRSHNVLVCCGDTKKVIRWRSFTQFCRHVEEMKLGPYFAGFGLSSGVGLGNVKLVELWRPKGLGTQIRIGGNGKTLQLAEMLRATYNLEATDPRDRIYALLGIAADADDHKLPPDYRLSVGEVYTSYACSFLEKNDALWILYFSQGPDSDLGIPSWVPNWCFTKSSVFSHWRFNFRHPYRADDGLPPRFHLSPSRKELTVAGIASDTITATSSVFDEPIAPKDFADVDRYAAYQRTTYDTWLKETFHLANRIRSAFPTPEQFFDEFWRTLCGNLAYSEHPAPARWECCAQIILFQMQLALDPDKNREAVENALAYYTLELQKALPPGRLAEEDFRAFVDQTRSSAWVNQLCVTRKGYLGLVSAKARPGDLVCVLFGGHVPFVLRRCEPLKEDYVLVGEAYVHARMHGEVVQEHGDKAQEFVLV